MARAQPWQPTPAQEAAALSLSDSSVGGRVRTHANGIAELRTIEGGGLHRYLIQPDGTATLVESRPRPRRYVWSYVLGWAGILLAVGAFALPAVTDTDDFWSAMLVIVGVAVFFIGMAIHPDGKPPAGERWKSIGGVED